MRKLLSTKKFNLNKRIRERTELIEMIQIAEENFCTHKAYKIKQDLIEIALTPYEFNLLVSMPCEQCTDEVIAMVHYFLND